MSMLTDNLTEEQRDSLLWALEYAANELINYLDVGIPEVDYGKEWAEVARERAKHMRAIADLSISQGNSQTWTDLAYRYETSAKNDEDLAEEL